MTSEKQPLGYHFDPPAKWIREGWEAGELSTERRDILLALFGRATTEKLARREPTPKLRLESLAAATRRGTDRRSLAALGRLLREMRLDGQLDYTTRGTGEWVVYVFTLYPDGCRSGVVPGSNRLPVPAAESAKSGSRSEIADAAANERSGSEAVDATTTTPGLASSIPGSEQGGNPLGERDRALPPSSPIPGSSEVFRTPTTAQSEEHAGVTRAREPGSPADEADSPVQAALASARRAQRRHHTQTWLATLPDEPRIVDGIVTHTSKRDFARLL